MSCIICGEDVISEEKLEHIANIWVSRITYMLIDAVSGLISERKSLYKDKVDDIEEIWDQKIIEIMATILNLFIEIKKSINENNKK